MNSNDLQNLSEAYNQVIQVDEGKSSRPRYPGGRGVLDQKTRDEKRESSAENMRGHTGGPGTVTKNPKKLRKQKAMGEIGEEVNTYNIILSHLLDEGYASTEEAADKIILNMSESWFEEIMEARRSEKEGKGSPESPLSYPGRSVQKERGERGGRHWQSGGQGGSETERGRKKSDKYSQAQRLRDLLNYPEKPGKYSEKQRKKRGGDIGSRFD